MKMKWRPFEHPDFSPTVIRRRITDEFIMLLALTMENMTNFRLSPIFTSSQSYYSALYRLNKSGLIVRRGESGRTPQLILTEKGQATLPDYWHPESFWKKKWKEHWYVLSYDVPEKERVYRDTLRKYLKRMRMGKLQKSLYITPHDIRPSFDDLTKGASVRDFAVLLQARSVLGHGDEFLVCQAWPIDRIRELQRHYCKVYTHNIERVLTRSYTPEDILQLAREEIVAFNAVMIDDPLLPRALYPEPYFGDRVVQLHRTLGQAISN